MKKIAASILALGLLALPAQADTGVKLGMLVCDVSGSIGLILGGTESASCTFQGPNGAEIYKGRITQVGIDIGDVDVVALVGPPPDVSALMQAS